VRQVGGSFVPQEAETVAASFAAGEMGQDQISGKQYQENKEQERLSDKPVQREQDNKAEE